jgi:orotate phosphoribosyltransferase
MVLKHDLARDLLNIKAVQINPDDYFTWTSGIKSPIYCDNRLTMSHPSIRKKITNAFVELLDKQEEKPDVIAGCATAGIPHAAWLADALELPMVYVRSKPKGHGKGNQIEGEVIQGQNVLVIEDLISTGGSSIDTAVALREAGMKVIGVFAIFTYGIKQSVTAFTEKNLKLKTIANFDQLIDALVEDGKLKNNDRVKLLEWRNGL